MACPRCSSTAPAVHGHCAACGAILSADETTVATGAITPPPLERTEEARPGGPAADAPSPSDAATTAGVGSAEAATSTGSPDAPTAPGVGRSAAGARSSGGPLAVGQNFGSRYHIIRLLGIGGMGAVYQAWDQVLEVSVAVKVIRPPETMDAEEARALERRFKRELLLARQVTHTNVVRIHDLGEIDGITYITMPYVKGSDLSTILKREGRLPVDRSLAIARQVASGLRAAHKAGVVHRDLKPANIMVDVDGVALIMDFGIARSTTAGMSMTVGGGIVGTIDYMAPEQARGETVDARADIYAFGLILYDTLLGRRAGGAGTAMSALLERMQHAPPAARSIDSAIPSAVDALVTKCLQPNPASRYQSLADLSVELDQLDADGHPLLATAAAAVTAALPLPAVAKPATPRRTRPARWKLVAAAGLVMAIGGASWVLRGRSVAPSPGPTAAVPAIALAVLPFRNASGDPTLDSLGSNLSQILGTMLGQSSHLRTVPSDRMNQVLKDLHLASNATLSPSDLSGVANFTNARRVLWGQYSRFGNAIRIDATLQDLDRLEAVPLNAMAPNESSLLSAISEIADAVRKDLARGSPDVLKELTATSWTPSTTSFEAMRLYNEGVRLTQQGTHQEALKSFEGATKQEQ